MSEIVVNSLQPNSISIMGSSCSLTLSHSLSLSALSFSLTNHHQFEAFFSQQLFS